MNKVIKIFSFFCVTAILASCSSTQKIAVQGTPETKIYNPNYEYLGTIQNSGTAQIELSKNDYVPFLFSHIEGSDTYVPFAINYKYTNYVKKTVTSFILGYPLCEIPALVWMSRNEIRIGNHFQYLPYQRTNQDILLTNYNDDGLRRSISNDAQEIASNDYTHVSSNTAGTSKAKSRASKSTKTFKDLGNLVTGTYVGSGELTFKGKVIEEYKNIRVVLSKIDKTHVNAEVIESNGESFFSSENRYGIEKSGGKYTMTLQGISSATITIGENGRLSYRHPKVNIDGDIYTLEISAVKK